MQSPTVYANKSSKYYDSSRYFYVCCYGGCGSWMLIKYLINFGNAVHIHSRKPPEELSYVGNINNNNSNYYFEHFNNIKVPNDQIINYTVIFLHRKPIKAIYSRFRLPKHLDNIGCDNKVTIQDVLGTKKDLYGIEEFFDNYTIPNNRNYKINCVKYEDFFDNMNVTNDPNLYPKKIERWNDYKDYDKLYSVYEKLFSKINKLKFIQII